MSVALRLSLLWPTWANCTWPVCWSLFGDAPFALVYFFSGSFPFPCFASTVCFGVFSPPCVLFLVLGCACRVRLLPCASARQRAGFIVIFLGRRDRNVSRSFPCRTSVVVPRTVCPHYGVLTVSVTRRGLCTLSGLRLFRMKVPLCDVRVHVDAGSRKVCG